MLDIRRLRMLHEFAARGSIARTADALGYTPSAVSQQLAVLEREAGTPLLDRTARSAGLTDAGRRLALHAELILAMVEQAESELSAQAAQPSGRVVVTAFPSAAGAFGAARVGDGPAPRPPLRRALPRGGGRAAGRGGGDPAGPVGVRGSRHRRQPGRPRPWHRDHAEAGRRGLR